jgi:hypothetical protein
MTPRIAGLHLDEGPAFASAYREPTGTWDLIGHQVRIHLKQEVVEEIWILADPDEVLAKMHEGG